MRRLTKAVFPVAGMGTRFLPATKASPKEMLPIVDKPLIQYAVEEALAAGMTELIFITGRNKYCIEDHFDKAYELEIELRNKNQQRLLGLIQSILPRSATCIYIRQPAALGLGHAVLCARAVVGDEPFAVVLADDLIDNDPGVLAQMAKVFASTRCSVLGIETVARKDTGYYGIVEVEERGDNGVRKVVSIVEKPSPEVAPSNLAVVGRYIFTPAIFETLRAVTAGAGGEIQLTDGIAQLLKDQIVLALPFIGTRYDCGSKLGYLKATVNYGLKHPEVREEFACYLQRFGSAPVVNSSD